MHTMKKSLLALAALAAVSGSAFAQSSVTIYGRLDQSLAQNSEQVKNRQVQQGSANRLGFRGVEDLGGGLKAFFQFEHRFTADDGVANPVFWDGKSFVGVQTAFGNVYIGREDSAAYALSQAPSDPWGTDTVAQNTTILNGRGIATTRYANSINYRGTFSGFTVGAQISERATTADGFTTPTTPVTGTGVKPQQVGSDRPWNIGANYATGPLVVGVGYEKPANEDAFWATVNGSWNFKVVKLMAMYGFGETGTLSSTGTARVNNERRGYIVGLTAPLGNGELRTSYAMLEEEPAAGGAKAKLDKQFGLGYHYALSKRTTVYADYVNEANDRVKAAGSNLEKNGFDIGVKHNF
jgi:predicted porin